MLAAAAIDDFVAVFLKGVVPALLAVAALGRMARGRLLPLALGTGFTIAFGLLDGWPELPHVLWNGSQHATHWLCWCVLAAALLATIGAMRWLPRAATAPLGFLLLAALPLLVTINVRRRMPTLDAALLVAGGAAALVVCQALLRRALEPAPAPSRPRLVAILIAICLCADGVVLLFGGSALFAQLGGALAAGFCLATLLIVLRPVPLDPSLALFLAAGHGGLLFLATCIAELPVLPALAAGLAPCSPILLRVERLARQPWLGPGSAIAMTAGLLAFAIAAVWAPPSY